MRLQTIILYLFVLMSCYRENKQTIAKEKLELILLGIPENFDTADLTKMGVQKYFCYDGRDSIAVKSCTYINNKTGEVIIPVKCNYYSLKLSKNQKHNFDFFINYTTTLSSGELIKNKNENCHCDLFGGWMAIHTDKNGNKRHFLFDCCNLPDSISDLCDELRTAALDNSQKSVKIGITINSDSIVYLSTKALAKEFKARREKNPPVKFEIR